MGNDDWKREEYDRRNVALLDVLVAKIDRLEVWAAGVNVKIGFVAAFSGIIGSVIGGTAVVAITSWLKLR